MGGEGCPTCKEELMVSGLKANKAGGKGTDGEELEMQVGPWRESSCI